MSAQNKRLEGEELYVCGAAQSRDGSVDCGFGCEAKVNGKGEVIRVTGRYVTV